MNLSPEIILTMAIIVLTAAYIFGHPGLWSSAAEVSNDPVSGARIIQGSDPELSGLDVGNKAMLRAVTRLEFYRGKEYNTNGIDLPAKGDDTLMLPFVDSVSGKEVAGEGWYSENLRNLGQKTG
jgi:hypothetical protein